MVHQSIAGSPAAGPAVRSVSLSDIHVAYRCSGRASPVVLIHGLAEDHTSWDPIVGRLPSDVQAYAPDMRGHGGTSIGHADGSVGQLAEDLLAFLQNVTGAANCVGFSLGGVVLLEAALRQPRLIRKAIVLGTSSKVGHVAAEFFRDRIDRLSRDIGGFRQALYSDTDAQIVRERALLSCVVEQRIRAVGDGQGYVNAARAMVALSEAPMTERLRAIDVPVHIIQGEKDVFCPRKAADILRGAMPNAGYTEIPNAGHLMTVDQPDLLVQEICRVIEV